MGSPSRTRAVGCCFRIARPAESSASVASPALVATPTALPVEPRITPSATAPLAPVEAISPPVTSAEKPKPVFVINKNHAVPAKNAPADAGWSDFGGRR